MVQLKLLSVREGEEHLVPKGSLAIDFKFFDLESLYRLYGKDVVDKYIREAIGRS